MSLEISVRKETIGDNKPNDSSSAFILDLRNSTKIIRKLSYLGKRDVHIKFMMMLHDRILKTLYHGFDEKYFAFNDTGDGVLCVFWDKQHALSSFYVVSKIVDFFSTELVTHNEKVKKLTECELGYGIGIHTGGSVVKRVTVNKGQSIAHKRDYIFGTVVNSAARLEAFTKNFITAKVLITGNFKDVLEAQAKEHNSNLLIDSNFEGCKFFDRVDLKDAKEGAEAVSKAKHNKGHNIYKIDEEKLSNFRISYE